MSNEPIAAGVARRVLPPPPFALKPVAWSEAQVERLRWEWQNVFRAFAYHPFVAVAALRGDPPTHYRVDFRVRSLVVDQSEQLQYVDAVAMEIWLPPGYPAEEPLVRPLAAVFHPNVSNDGVRFPARRQSDESLVNVIGRIGEYLACRNYDAGAVVNDVAMQWMIDNAELLPLDARADFLPTAGGEPLGRIQRFGPATLEQMGRSMDEVLAALSGEAASPTIEQVRTFARQTRVAMRVFMADDVPAALRQAAAEFDQSALDLPASVPSWRHVGRLKAWAKSALAQSGELKAAMEQLDGELEKLLPLVVASFADAGEAARQIPPAAVLQPILLHLPPVYKDAANRAEALRALTGETIAARPPNPLPDNGAVARRLAERLKEADEEVEFARHVASETLSALAAKLLRARAEVMALRAIGGWREYIDTFEKAAVVEQRLAALSGDAIEAYTISSPDGEFGPFQLEQEVALGQVSVAVTSQQPGAIEVCNAADETVLGRGAGGSAVAMLPNDAGPPTAMTFNLSEGCDQLLLQLEYALRHTSALLPKLQSLTAGEAESWCGRMLTLFADPEAQQGARSEQRRASHRWEALIEELKALSAFKARLATWFMVRRAEALIARLLAQRAAHKTTLAEATQRIESIAAKSNRDAETGQLIVPPKYAKTFAEQSDAMEVAKKGVRRIDSRLEKLSNRLRARLASPRSCGRPELPAFRKIGAISAELSELAAQITDDALRAAAARLAAQLKTTLMVNITPPPEPKSAKPQPAMDLGAPAAIEAPVVSEGAEPEPVDVPEAGQSEEIPTPQPGDGIIAAESIPGRAEAPDEMIAGSSDEEFVVDDDVIVDGEDDDIVS